MTRYVGSYREYLRSPYWRARRRQAIHAAGHRCHRCPASARLEVHHRTYLRLGCELPADLEVLCGDCHASAHGAAPRVYAFPSCPPEPIGSILPRALARMGLEAA